MTTLEVRIQVPEDLSPEERAQVLRDAQEAPILGLWQKARISTREAAAALQLTYREFLELVSMRGLSIADHDLDIAAVAATADPIPPCFARRRMIAVIDANSIIGLAKGECFDLLAQVFSQVYVPAAVRREIVDEGAGLPGRLNSYKLSVTGLSSNRHCRCRCKF